MSLNLNKFGLNSGRFGRAQLTRTSDLEHNGWKGGVFKQGEKEAHVYWYSEIGLDPYIYYGWWIDQNNANGDTSVVLFADTTEENASFVDPSTIIGSATYEGGSVGQYATIAPDYSSGSFVADASLVANFDTNIVSGRLDNFVVNGQRKDDWKVSLQRNSNAPVNNQFVGVAVWERDGLQPNDQDIQASEWYAGFGDADTDELNRADVTIGYFQVKNRQASMVGTFAATHNPENTQTSE